VHEKIRDRTTHDQLQKNLIEHQWVLEETEEDME
jgi:hypothetical protein